MPADLEALILKCLAKDRADRFPSATAVRTALLGCVDAANYDAAAASAWWRDRHAVSAPPRPISTSAPTMAIDLRDRNAADAEHGA